MESGRIGGLAGGNGLGKSTLIKILSGVIPVDVGGIVVLGQNLDGVPTTSSRTTKLSQKSNSLHDTANPRQNKRSARNTINEQLTVRQSGKEWSCERQDAHGQEPRTRRNPDFDGSLFVIVHTDRPKNHMMREYMAPITTASNTAEDLTCQLVFSSSRRVETMRSLSWP